MNELRRRAYLEALGVDSYISRTQLPGAALTRRLAIVPALAAQLPAAARAERATAAARESLAVGTVQSSNPREPDAVVAQSPVAATTESLPRSTAVPRFSLTAIVAGKWLWLEDLGSMPLTREQVQLVHAMAQALLQYPERNAALEASAKRPDPAQPLVAQFDWPIHTNHQLDLGAEAAGASVAAFVSRRLEQHGCSGLVLLGQDCALRVPLQDVECVSVQTVSSAQILAQPGLKRSVWRDLLPLVSKS